jgi:ankyrin repeat protein
MSWRVCLALCSIALMTSKHADGITLPARNIWTMPRTCRISPDTFKVERGFLRLRGGEGDANSGSSPPNITDTFRLWEAARDGNLEALKATVQAGIDPLSKDGDDMTALHHASAWGRTECCEYLLALGAEVSAKACDGSTALHLSAWYGHLDTCQMLISKGASVTERDKDGSHPLHNAAFKGQDEICLVLLKAGGQVDAAQVIHVNVSVHAGQV